MTLKGVVVIDGSRLEHNDSYHNFGAVGPLASQERTP
jgi:hypothetical protein